MVYLEYPPSYHHFLRTFCSRSRGPLPGELAGWEACARLAPRCPRPGARLQVSARPIPVHFVPLIMLAVLAPAPRCHVPATQSELAAQTGGAQASNEAHHFHEELSFALTGERRSNATRTYRYDNAFPRSSQVHHVDPWYSMGRWRQASYQR